MEKDGSSTKEMYIKWKKGNNVTAESQWNNINFNGSDIYIGGC